MLHIPLMNFPLAFFSALFVALLLFPDRAFAQSPTIESLCAEGVEGSFVGKLRKVDGKTLPVRLNIVCLRPDRIVSSISFLSQYAPGADGCVTFGYTAIDDDQIIFSEYSVLPEDRDGAPARTKGGYMRFSLSSLRKHEPVGYYTGGTASRLLSFSAKRVQEFPRLTPALAEPVPKGWLVGHWGIEKSNPVLIDLTADVLMGAPVFAAVVVDGQRAVHLIDSPRWSETGVFSSVNPTQDFEEGAHHLFHIRGRLLSEKTMEVYWVSPHVGLVGPLRATKLNEF
jgi:hypothetical protein